MSPQGWHHPQPVSPLGWHNPRVAITAVASVTTGLASPLDWCHTKPMSPIGWYYRWPLSPLVSVTPGLALPLASVTSGQCHPWASINPRMSIIPVASITSGLALSLWPVSPLDLCHAPKLVSPPGCRHPWSGSPLGWFHAPPNPQSLCHPWVAVGPHGCRCLSKGILTASVGSSSVWDSSTHQGTHPTKMLLVLLAPTWGHPPATSCPR